MDLSRRLAVISWWLVCAHACYAGEIEGIVRLNGPAPAPAVVALNADSKGAEECGSLTRTSQRRRVSREGGVQNAVVWLDLPASAPRDELAPREVVVDQRGCEFVPHVVLVPPGSTLVVRNSDTVLHNVRVFEEKARVVEEWQRPRAEPLTMRLPGPDRYLLRCGVHSWMYAWAIAASHPAYAVTDEAGRFRLANVGPGDYTLQVWHETFSGTAQPVHVGTRTARITMSVVNEQGG